MKIFHITIWRRQSRILELHVRHEFQNFWSSGDEVLEKRLGTTAMERCYARFRRYFFEMSTSQIRMRGMKKPTGLNLWPESESILLDSFTNFRRTLAFLKNNSSEELNQMFLCTPWVTVCLSYRRLLIFGRRTIIFVEFHEGHHLGIRPR